MLPKLQNLKTSLERQNNHLRSVSNNEAETLQDLESKTRAHENRLKSYQSKEQESLSFLLGLQKTAAAVSEQVTSAEEVTDSGPTLEVPEVENPKTFTPPPSLQDILTTNDKTWQSPLDIPLEISAEFMDPAYENQFGKPHYGSDFRAPQGSRIRAPKDGTVIKVAENNFEYSIPSN